jgi:hypothetical protein
LIIEKHSHYWNDQNKWQLHILFLLIAKKKGEKIIIQRPCLYVSRLYLLSTVVPHASNRYWKVSDTYRCRMQYLTWYLGNFGVSGSHAYIYTMLSCWKAKNTQYKYVIVAYGTTMVGIPLQMSTYLSAKVPFNNSASIYK